jgi:membrane-associated phospholipid phosphatase
MGAGDMGLLRHWLYDWGGLNTQLMLWINRCVRRRTGSAWRDALSAIGSYWGAPLMGLACCWAGGQSSAPNLRRLAPFRFGVGVLVAMLLAWTAKAGFALPRPSDLYANDLVWVLGRARQPLCVSQRPCCLHGSGRRLPLAPRVPGRFRLLLLALAAAVGWSRVALGAHFPADVVAGFLLGGACVVATHGWAVSLRRAADKWRATR